MLFHSNMNILVAGGAGYIGSHAVRALLKANHEVTVIDDLSHGHRDAVDSASIGLSNRAKLIEINISDTLGMVQALRDHSIQAVIHFASFIEVGESVQDPQKYYLNNFSGSLSLMSAMMTANVKKLVFSSTAAVYGHPLSNPILEDQARAPINPYGRSKMMVEMAIEDFAHAYGLGYAILRYFNVAGASADGVIGEAHEPESHLIPNVLAVAVGKAESIQVFGTDYPTPDGTCIRDYIHVEDLVNAHLLALEKIKPGQGSIYNLGSEKGFSVREVIHTCEKVTGRSLTVVEKPRRVGDPAVLVASSAKIRQELGWKQSHPSLETIVLHAWKWHQSGRKLR